MEAEKTLKKSNSLKVDNALGISDIISIDEFSRKQIELVHKIAAEMEEMSIKEKMKILEGKVVGSLFFEPSTRTRLSFESSVQHLGGRVIGFSDAKSTSVKKKETLSDTIRMIEKYVDCIVMRHPLPGSARRAAEVSTKPVINGGDGANQHPTQTLLDLYTIKKAFGKIDGLNIGMVGDLKYGRTVHSLATALGEFDDIELSFIALDSLKMPRHLVESLEGKVKIKEGRSLDDFIPDVDVLYVTRIQEERFPDPYEYEKVKNEYVVSADTIKNAKSTMKIMHPLPRVNEITLDVDDTPHCLYFEEAANGLPVRQALLGLMIGGLK